MGGSLWSLSPDGLADTFDSVVATLTFEGFGRGKSLAIGGNQGGREEKQSDGASESTFHDETPSEEKVIRGGHA